MASDEERGVVFLWGKPMMANLSHPDMKPTCAAIGKLLRERDEARAELARRKEGFKQLDGCYAAACRAFGEYKERNKELKALCREAGDELYAWVATMLEHNPNEPGTKEAIDLIKRLREKGGEE